MATQSRRFMADALVSDLKVLWNNIVQSSVLPVTS